MTKTFHRVFIRNSLENEFPEDPVEFTQYMTDVYVTSGQCLQHRVAEYSADNLIKFCTSVWKNSESFDIAFLDPKFLENQRFLTIYCEENNMSMNVWIE